VPLQTVDDAIQAALGEVRAPAGGFVLS